MHQRRLDISGQVFGRLTALEIERITPSGAAWACRCACGNTCIVKASLLRNGNTKSCGCLKKEIVAAKNYRHGLLVRGHQSPEFYAFLNAKRRCANPADKRYSDYGGRGIQFKFATFEEFFAEIGPRPSPDHSVDRKDNSGHYEPGNLKWSTRTEQQRNRRIRGASGIKGVRLKPKNLNRPWVAEISRNNKPVYLGAFATAKDASAAYTEAVKRFR